MKSLVLSEDLKNLLQKRAQNPISFGELVDTAGDRAFGIIFLILAFPSALPIPATGISTPLGIAMFLLSLQIMAGREQLWVPQKVRNLSLPFGAAEKMIRALAWVLTLFEKILRPRWLWLHQKNGRRITAFHIALLCIVMQVPVPLTNTIPAAVIFIQALALTEDDGLVGFVANLLAVTVVTAYVIGFGALLYLGFTSFDQLFEWIRSEPQG